MSFKALIVERDEAGTTSASVRTITGDRLPDGDVAVAVEYSTLNYKDGLCLGSGGGLVKSYPHVPGIDFAGTVEQSDDPRYAPGDKVVLTGWRVGEQRGDHARDVGVRELIDHVGADDEVEGAHQRRVLRRLAEVLAEMLARLDRTELAEACFAFLHHRVRLDLAGFDDVDIFHH